MIRNKTIKWDLSAATDVVNYKISIDRVAITDASPSVLLPADATSYELPGAFTSLTAQEGSDWMICVSAIDDGGNTGDALIGPMELDFFAPAAVTNLRVE